MTSLKQFELQQQIKENSQGIVNTINELHKWEKDIKRTSAANCQTKKNESSYPIRSHKENVVSNGHTKPTETVTAETSQNDVATTVVDANSYKDLGNKCVKSSDFAAAIKHYTKAIEIKEDPVFYSNRAFCHLKLEQYTDCIDDCSKAVLLDPKLVKGFYRRMQANEVLSNFDLALKDCKEVLKLDPKNTDAIQANQRLSNRIAGKDLTQSPSNANVLSWSKLNASVKDVTFIKKPPHLRSKKPLRRIPINEPLPTNNCTLPDKKSKDEENEAFKSAEVDAEQSNQTSNGISEKVAAMIPTKSPNSSAQFYRTWRELSDDSQKYSYLKIIEVTELNKLLGPQFTSEMFKDLLKITSENFISDNIPVTGILKQIIINDEFKILKMFMDTEDKNAFEKILKYIESNESSADDLAFIKDKYFN